MCKAKRKSRYFFKIYFISTLVWASILNGSMELTIHKFKSSFHASCQLRSPGSPFKTETKAVNVKLNRKCHKNNASLYKILHSCRTWIRIISLYKCIDVFGRQWMWNAINLRTLLIIRHSEGIFYERLPVKKKIG